MIAGELALAQTPTVSRRSCLRILPSRFGLLRLALLTLSVFQATGATNAIPDLLREFRVRAWSKESGLPDNKVLALHQTRDGYLWLGTPFGLVRFDGVTFTPFTRGTHPEMPSDHCHTLAEDGGGILWIGTEQGVLGWDGRQFLRPPAYSGAATGAVTLLAVAQDFGIWSACGPDLLHSAAGGRGAATDYPQQFEIRSLCSDGADGVWFGGIGNDLRRWPSPMGLPESVAVPAGLEHSAILSLKVLADHRLGAVFRLPDRSDQFAMFTAGRWQLATGFRTANEPRPAFFFADHTGAVWLPDGAKGLARWRNARAEHLGAPWGAEEDFALCGLADREGNVWIGTERSGLLCLTPKQLSAITPRDGLPHEFVRSLWPARAGGVWAGTDHGLSRLGPDLQIITNWLQADGEPLGKLKAVAELADGTIWFGVDHDQFTLRDGQFTRHHYVRPPGDRSHDDNDTGFNKVRCFLPARDGSLWLAVPRGLHRRRDGADQRFTTAHGLGADDVRALLETRDGTIWAGTAGGGLSRFTGDTNHPFTTLTRRDGLSRDTVWALLEASDGALWAGTDGGLNRLDHGRITRFDRRHGLPEDAVNCLLEDAFGYLWVGHEHGLYRVSRTELTAVAEGRASRVHCVPFGLADGLPVAECNGQTATPAACQTADGRLWFATPKGIVVADPKTFHENDVPPPVVIERVIADERTVFPALSAGNGPAESPSKADLGTSGRELWIAPGQARFLEFHFTANTFVAAETASFRYRLEGYEDIWHDAGTRRFAHYIGIPPGRYQFRVLAANHHQVWNETGASLAFRLAPYFWQTAWFWTLVTLVSAGTVAGLVRWRLREKDRFHHLEAARLAAEEQLRHGQELALERQRLARHLHDDVGANFVLLHGLAERLGRPGEPAATVRRLTETIGETHRQVRELMWVADPGDTTLDGLADRLGQQAAETLESFGVRVRLEVPEALPAVTLTPTQRREFLSAFKEVLANVVKHAAATEMRLHLSATPTLFRAVVSDNGGGFTPANLKPAAGDGGRGLGNLRARLAELGGRATIESAPGQGTRVVLELPLGR